MVRETEKTQALTAPEIFRRLAVPSDLHEHTPACYSHVMNVHVGSFLLSGFLLFLDLLSWAIIIRAVISWFKTPAQYGFISTFFVDVTEPIYRVIRRYVRPIGPMDFSPIVALLALMVIRWAVITLVAGNLGIVDFVSR